MTRELSASIKPVLAAGMYNIGLLERGGLSPRTTLFTISSKNVFPKKRLPQSSVGKVYSIKVPSASLEKDTMVSLSVTPFWALLTIVRRTRKGACRGLSIVRLVSSNPLKANTFERKSAPFVLKSLLTRLIMSALFSSSILMTCSVADDFGSANSAYHLGHPLDPSVSPRSEPNAQIRLAI
ncbi:hypothetical protein D9M68_656060 [compost metagenome]